MARRSAILSVRILADAQNAVAGMQKTSGAAGLLGKAFGALAGLAVGKKLLDFGRDAVTAAGELEQSAGAVDAVFGKSSGQMEKWAAGAATAVGLTKNEYNELGTLIGAQLKNGGTAMDELAPKTNKLIGLGADLASMFGGSSKEAVEALSSALKGERDPIERYGVSLNQAKIDAEAAALGFKKVGGSLSAEANQAATLSLIMKQTADAHGNFAAESSTLMGQQERARAMWGNITATIGGLFLPALTAVFSVLTAQVLPAVQTFADGLGAGGLAGALGPLSPLFSTLLAAVVPVGQAIAAQVGPALSMLGQVFGPLIPQVLSLVTQFSPLAIVLQLVGQFLPQLVPMFAQVAAVVGTVLSTVVPLATSLAGMLVPLFVQFATSVLPLVVEAVTTVVGALQPLVTTLLGVLVPVVQSLLPIIVGVVQGILANVTGVITGLVQVITGVVDFVGAIFRGDWAAAWSAVQQIVSGAVTAVVNLVQLWIVGRLVSLARGALSAVSGLFRGAWSGIQSLVSSILSRILGVARSALSGLTSAVRGALSGITSSWRAGWQAALSLLSGVWRGITTAVSGGIGRILGLFRSLPGKIRGALAGAGSWLVSTGRNIVQGLINGAGQLLGNIGRFFLNKLPGWIRGPFQSALGIASPSRVFAGYGRNIVEGLAGGVESEQTRAVKAVAGMATRVARTGQLALDSATASLEVPTTQLRLGATPAAGQTVHHHTMKVEIQAGVGDPVAIGREVDRVLSRYRRTLGTVAHAGGVTYA